MEKLETAGKIILIGGAIWIGYKIWTKFREVGKDVKVGVDTVNKTIDKLPGGKEWTSHHEGVIGLDPLKQTTNNFKEIANGNFGKEASANWGKVWDTISSPFKPDDKPTTKVAWDASADANLAKIQAAAKANPKAGMIASVAKKMEANKAQGFYYSHGSKTSSLTYNLAETAKMDYVKK